MSTKYHARNLLPFSLLCPESRKQCRLSFVYEFGATEHDQINKEFSASDVTAITGIMFTKSASAHDWILHCLLTPKLGIIRFSQPSSPFMWYTCIHCIFSLSCSVIVIVHVTIVPLIALFSRFGY